MPDISLEAQALLDRLAATDPANPRHDKPAIEQAIVAHLAALGLPKRPFRWMPDAHSGFRYVGVVAFEDPPENDFEFDVRGRLDPIWFSAEVDSITRDDIGAMNPAWRALWDTLPGFALGALRIYLWTAADDDDESGTSFAAAEAVREGIVGASLGIVAVDRASRESSLATRREFAVWRPMIDAFEAGLFLHWVTQDEVVCVLHPITSRERGLLHSTIGPAVAWPSGEAYHFWRGVMVPAWVIEEPGRITVAVIQAEVNQEVRRCMVEIYGRSRYLRDTGARLVHQDDFGRLWEAEGGEGERWRFVEVEDGTPSLEGTCRIYTLDVTDAAEMLGWPIETARAAVAATYGLREDEYCPEMRT